MGSNNLSATLFRKNFHSKETSTIVNDIKNELNINTIQDGHWYRFIDPVLWWWWGVSPIELKRLMAKIAATKSSRSFQNWLDTIIGYNRGNWIFEWIQQGVFFQKELQLNVVNNKDELGVNWIRSASYFSIAGYPHLIGDELAKQSLLLIHKAYDEAFKFLPYRRIPLEFKFENKVIKGFLYLPNVEQAPFLTVILCNDITNVQTDNFQFFLNELAPAGLAMVTFDLPGVGASVHWKLSPDSSKLYHCILENIMNIAWIDHTKIAVLGIKFGAHLAIRLAYLFPNIIKAVACFNPVVHQLFIDEQVRSFVPRMYMDVLINRIGMSRMNSEIISAELFCYSLKTQGLLGRSCSVPLFCVTSAHEPASQSADIELIANSFRMGTVYNSSTHGHQANLPLIFNKISTWIKKQLN